MHHPVRQKLPLETWKNNQLCWPNRFVPLVSKRKRKRVRSIDTNGYQLKLGARPSRSPLATSRCEHLTHQAFGATPTAARETHALPISPLNWKNSIPITP